MHPVAQQSVVALGPRHALAQDRGALLYGRRAREPLEYAVSRENRALSLVTRRVPRAHNRVAVPTTSALPLSVRTIRLRLQLCVHVAKEYIDSCATAQPR